MSIYKDLNDVQLDLSKYNEELLTDIDHKRWEKRVLKKLHKRKRNNSKKWIGIAAALILTLGITTPFGQATLAQMPLVGGLIERFIDQEKPLDYSPYKTAIGETAQNKYGKLTLNEVLVEADRLLISSTFEPVKGVKFNYQTHLPATVLINGVNIQKTALSQSIKVNDDMYTIYGDVKFSELPKEGPLQIKLMYDTFSTHKRTAIEDPWVFDVNVSTNQIAKDTKTFKLDKTITLDNGEQVTLEKVMVSPVSTLVYYDLTKASESISFKLISANGEEIPFREGYNSDDEGETSSVRFGPIDLKKETYSLVPISKDDLDKAIGPEVPIQ